MDFFFPYKDAFVYLLDQIDNFLITKRFYGEIYIFVSGDFDGCIFLDSRPHQDLI